MFHFAPGKGAPFPKGASFPNRGRLLPAVCNGVRQSHVADSSSPFFERSVQ